MEPEVRVRTVRRRRSEPPPLSPPPPNVRNWLIYAGVTVALAALMADGYLSHRPHEPVLPDYSMATDVRSTISQSVDSLEVIVTWDLTLSDLAGRPDSIRIKVKAEPRNDTLVSVQSAGFFADTLYLPAPAPGQSVRGVSCVAAEQEGQMPQESCTPWQYVRPTATAELASAVVSRIVIQPSGLQVDPDVGGRCARWQRSHPDESVWIAVNRTAVPDCTGPNRKPTVAQFCAFAVLPDGRKVKTANSANNSYCDELFMEWTRERYS